MLDRIFVRLLLLPLLMSCLCADSSASELGLRQLHHRSWHARDGAPSDVHRVVQDKAGFLWLATTGGLFRFDGVRFESVESIYHVALWTSEVISLQVSRDGGLWIGYRFGGASYLRDGKITHYQYQLKGDNFFPGAGVRGFAEDKDGTIWAITDRLNQFKNNKWQAIEPGIPKGRGTGLLIDRRGGVWAAFASGVYWRRDERSGFIKVSESSKPTHFAEAPDGTIWAVTDAQGLARFDPASGRLLGTMPGSDRGMRSGRPMFDREGNLWCASLDASVQRITAQDLAKDAQLTQQFVEEFSEKDGLSGGLVTNVLQDREGNVWVATSSGIDRFRESPVSRIPVPVPQGAVVLGMAPADDGKIWVTDWNGGLFLADKSAEPVDDSLKNMSMMYRAPSGRLWMGNPEALWLRENGKTRQIPWPVHAGAQVPQAAAEDAQGGLWVSLTYDGVFRFHDGKWEDKTPMLNSGNPTAYALMADAQGNMWLSYGMNTLLQVGATSVIKYGPAYGLDLSSIIAIVPVKGELWLGGTDGTMHFDGKRFRKLLGAGSHVFKGVSGIVPTANGDLWLNGDDGIIHVHAEELAKWRADTGYQVHYEKLDFLDGVIGKPKHSRPVPTALAGSDGRLWFTIGKTLMRVDPARRPQNALPPPVTITEVDIDGVKLSDGSPVVLPPGAQRIEINFAALSLSVPERNRYRYRVVGIGDEWNPVGQRRAVAYTNLSPGQYRFEVSATNNDGVWSTRPAQLDFKVLPKFHQTWWFQCAVALLLALALWLLHRLRLNVLTQRISDRLQSQQLERVRIARELHDTLLQGVGSLSLMVHTAINKVDSQHPLVPFLSDGLKQAETVIAEGRERVARLRVDEETGDALIDELGMLGLELMTGRQTRFTLTVQGTARKLARQVAAECRGIAREAIWNAVQHADAATITLVIEFARRELVLHVRDDGRGISEAVLAAGGREGHWGIPGMRERAARIGGRLEFRAGLGLTVSLRVPAKLAYRLG